MMIYLTWGLASRYRSFLNWYGRNNCHKLENICHPDHLLSFLFHLFITPQQFVRETLTYTSAI